MSEHAHQFLVKTSKKHLPGLIPYLDHAGALSIPIPKVSSLYRHLAQSIVGQQLSDKAANAIWSRLLKAAEEDGGLERFLNRAGFDELRACGLSGAKVKTLLGMHSQFQNGHLNEAELNQAPKPTRYEKLTALWGIGPWTVDMLHIFYWSDEDVYSPGDLVLVRVLAELAGFPLDDKKQAAALAELYKPYRTYLSLQLWRSVDMGYFSAKDPKESREFRT